MKPACYLAAVAALAVGVAGCDDDRASVFTPIGPLSYDFTVASAPAGLPGGTVAVGGGAATLTLSGLRDLSSGAYQFWAVSQDAAGQDVYTRIFGSVVEFFTTPGLDPVTGGVLIDPVTGDTIFVTDSTVIATAASPVNSYTGYIDPLVFSVRIIADSAGDGSAVDAANTILVTLETSAGATAPSAAKFLWRRISAAGGGAVSFGNFGGTEAVDTDASSARDFIYPVIGVGRAGIRGLEISVDFTRIGRPPVGFFYRGYLLDEDGAATMVDILRTGFSAVAVENRISLVDADIDGLLPGVSSVAIESSQIRNCGSGSTVPSCAGSLSLSGKAPFRIWVPGKFVLTLDPKNGGSGIGLNVVFEGDVPEILADTTISS